MRSARSSYRIAVTVNADGTWSYERGHGAAGSSGSDELFHHTDRNTLKKVAEPTPNWLMRKS